jgi:hypothetical protein
MNVKKKIPTSLKDESGKINLFPDKFCIKKNRPLVVNKVEED